MVIDNTVNRIAPFIDRNFALKVSSGEEGDQSFADTLRGVLGDVNRLQIEADQSLDQLLTGDIDNLHQVMIKAEEAQLSLQLTVQVVNKVVQAYQEISRMQI